MSRQQPIIEAASPEPNVTEDLSQRKSSCTSMGLPADTGIPTIETTAQQHYPVDEITQRTPCELQTVFKNLTFTVAYDIAMPTQPGDVYHGQQIPPRYTRVGVEQVCQSWETRTFEIVKTLVPPEVVSVLPTQMYKLHQHYIYACDGRLHLHAGHKD